MSEQWYRVYERSGRTVVSETVRFAPESLLRVVLGDGVNPYGGPIEPGYREWNGTMTEGCQSWKQVPVEQLPRNPLMRRPVGDER